MVVQWGRLHSSIAGGMSLIPDQGNKIPHTGWHGQKFEKQILIILKIYSSNQYMCFF